MSWWDTHHGNQIRKPVNNGPCFGCCHMMKHGRNPNKLTYLYHKNCLKQIRKHMREKTDTSVIDAWVQPLLEAHTL